MKVHENHLGMDKCRARARSAMYWPSMCQEIHDMIARRSICAKFRKANQREPLIPHEIDDYADDGRSGEVGLLCSFYHEPLRT